jgi:hypothetical protein
MSLNVKLLRKIKKHILKEPRRFFMYDVIQTGQPRKETYTDDRGKQVKFPSCGTAACIAGWACVLNQAPVSMREAEYLLGINGQEGTNLFLVDFWPQPFQDKFNNAKTGIVRAKIAAARIDHFIQTKGAK